MVKHEGNMLSWEKYGTGVKGTLFMPDGESTEFRGAYIEAVGLKHSAFGSSGTVEPIKGKMVCEEKRQGIVCTPSTKAPKKPTKKKVRRGKRR